MSTYTILPAYTCPLTHVQIVSTYLHKSSTPGTYRWDTRHTPYTRDNPRQTLINPLVYPQEYQCYISLAADILLRLVHTLSHYSSECKLLQVLSVVGGSLSLCLSSLSWCRQQVLAHKSRYPLKKFRNFMPGLQNKKGESFGNWRLPKFGHEWTLGRNAQVTMSEQGECRMEFHSPWSE